MRPQKYALVDAHGTVFGWYDERSAAEADLEELTDLGEPDLGIIEVDKQPSLMEYRMAALNWLIRKVDDGHERMVARLHAKDDVRRQDQ